MAFWGGGMIGPPEATDVASSVPRGGSPVMSSVATIVMLIIIAVTQIWRLMSDERSWDKISVAIDKLVVVENNQTEILKEIRSAATSYNETGKAQLRSLYENSIRGYGKRGPEE